MGVTALAAFALVELTLCLIPGPAVLYVFSSALRRGRRAGLSAASGIVAGNTAYFALSAAGIATLLLTSYALFGIVKWCGVAYLAYLGVRALFAADIDTETVTPARTAHGSLFAGAFVTQISNPKAIAFFVAILPQFLNPHGNVVLQLLVLTLISAVIEFGVMTGYTLAATRLRRTALAKRTALWIERAGGAILLALAALVAREPIASAP